ncbi:hypothetical protein Syun_018377 [Stephania yunnanensis]|uniref:Uncharacterized protein n=1 Tax=Stephania yunnanensis TaxID=152371 RepID=A0AAP0NWZ4_9MAGN
MEVEMERSIMKGAEISSHDLRSSWVENNYRYFPDDPCLISEEYDYSNFSIRSLLKEVRGCCLSENSVVDVGSSSCEGREGDNSALHLPGELFDEDFFKAINGDIQVQEVKEEDRDDDEEELEDYEYNGEDEDYYENYFEECSDEDDGYEDVVEESNDIGEGWNKVEEEDDSEALIEVIDFEYDYECYSEDDEYGVIEGIIDSEDEVDHLVLTVFR